MTNKEKVKQILQKYPETRNCDISLTVYLWFEFYPEKINKLEEYLKEAFKSPGARFTVKSVLIAFLRSVINEDDTRRIRAHVQNEEGLYLPTDPKVIKQRKIKQSNWQEIIN